MSFKRCLQATFLMLAFTTTSASLATPPARSALLIEGNFDGKALRIVVDVAKSRAEVTLDDDHHRVDLASNTAQRVAADGTVEAVEVLADARTPAPEIKPWGPGPTIAGYPSVYHVMTLGEEICGELLISPWMKPFVDPAVQALAILERVKGEVGVKSTGLDGACGTLPFSSFATLGWPLMAGGIEQPVFTTEKISFDYEPNGDELAWSKAY